jgi:hypothetical protein
MFAAAKEDGVPGGMEHAFQPDATLCGIPAQQVSVYRHLFLHSSRPCPRCRELAAAAPTMPCTQELLHGKVLAAEPGPLRTQLLEALAGGARIAIWVNGPAGHVAGHANADRITQGAGAVTALLGSGGRIGIARVAGPSGEFVVVLPEREAPVIAFAAQ